MQQKCPDKLYEFVEPIHNCELVEFSLFWEDFIGNQMGGPEENMRNEKNEARKIKRFLVLRGKGSYLKEKIWGVERKKKGDRD